MSETEHKELDSGGDDLGDSRAERFFSLFMDSQNQIFGYILMLVPDSNDADDIMQDTAAILWKKFDQFEVGTNFLAWAITIARYRILQYRCHKRKSMMHFNDGIWGRLEEVASKSVHERDDRLSAVKRCTEKLSVKDQKLIEFRYYHNFTTKKVAERTGRSRSGVYRNLARIHSLLHECVRNTLASWETT